MIQSPYEADRLPFICIVCEWPTDDTNDQPLCDQCSEPCDGCGGPSAFCVCE